MNERKMWALLAGPGLGVAGLLVALILLGQGVLGAASAGAAPVLDVQNQDTRFTVSGVVTCEAAGGPISEVEVFVWDREGGDGVLRDTTDVSGAYSVTLEAGSYDFIFQPRCDSDCASQSIKGITGLSDQRRDIGLPRGYKVSGIVDDGVNPVGNVSIYAFNQNTAEGFGVKPTDSNGTYCVSLMAGTYDLGFTPPPCRNLGPETVVINVDQDVSSNIHLPSGFTVGGCVADSHANPVSGVQIYAFDPPPLGAGGFGFAPTNQTGCYSGTLPSGTYDFQFIPPPGQGMGAVTFVDVGRDTGGCPNTLLDVSLPAGFTISGTTTCNGRPIKNVFAYADPVAGSVPDDDLVGWGLFTVDDGSYELPLVPGTYKLSFKPPAASGLDAEAFAMVELVTDTLLNVDFCTCSGDWMIETVDSAGDVGAYTSLALEPTRPYIPHISYYDVAGDRLMHAWLKDATWLTEEVDSPGGQWTSLALAPTYPYTPCISYLDNNVSWDLKFACRDNSTDLTVVNGMRAGQNGTSLALEPDYPYRPHISFFNPWGTIRTLGRAYLDGTDWMSGTWETEPPVEPIGSEAGWWNSLALESNMPYNPHISYYDGANGDLKHAWFSGGTWQSETVDSEGDVGWYTSLELGSSDNPHISYFDNTNASLKYARLSGATWLSRTLDSTGTPGWGRGATSLELGLSDNPHICYYDAVNGDLKYVRFDGTVWVIQAVDSEGDVGQFCSLALDRANCPHISYYDAAQGDLKYTSLSPLETFLPIVLERARP